MTETTMNFDYPQDATPEKIWAILQRNAEQMEKSRKEADLRKEEADRRMEELKQQMKETDRKIGHLSNRFGEMAEYMVAPGIKEKFNALGFTFEQVAQNIEITDAADNLVAEIDILLENGDTIMAVEVKIKPNPKDVETHIERMEILRRRADARNDKRSIQGAIAGVVMSKEQRACVSKAGFYLIEQTGDTVRIHIPEGFEPRRW